MPSSSFNSRSSKEHIVSIAATSVIDQIAASLSAKSLEHQVIASNIANRDTEGYQRLKVEFERVFDSVTPRIGPETTASPISTEEDMLALSTNAGSYQSLARSLSRYFSLINIITTASRG
jgi:flagellar basal body rod protein FlgB